MPSEPGAATASADSLTLRQVRRQFPQFAIWHERVHERSRFIARARDLGTSPHTVITGDLREMHDALAGDPAPPRDAART